MPGDRPRSAETTQAKFCVVVIIIGAGIFMIGTTTNRDNHIVTALSILGPVLFLVGTFTLLLVLMGVSSTSRTKPSRDPTVTMSETSASFYETEAEYLSAITQQNVSRQQNTASATQESNNQRETQIISLHECPKEFVSVHVQPPPTYEEAIAMACNSREHEDVASSSNSKTCSTSNSSP